MFPTAAVIFYSWDFCGHSLLLLPSSNTASCDFLCCQRFQTLSSSSSATVVFYYSDFCYHRLSLLPSLLRATSFVAVIFYFVWLSLLPSSSTVTVIFC
ncbi:hypothetical protein CDAR_265781 [Caerostris darwini]|uniref:Uncharacterized protein n=1 Tax=Caerostris darwini TaxID=1538125 RepID=A0AAV4V887_9ARAC|nr:hypothetical protein CDAR_265781 [Caerostris darwini]